jgi:hypothetical protein
VRHLHRNGDSVECIMTSCVLDHRGIAARVPVGLLTSFCSPKHPDYQCGPTNKYEGFLYQYYSSQSVKLTTNLYLWSRLRMKLFLPPSPHTFISCTGQFSLTLSKPEGRGFLEPTGPVQACTGIARNDGERSVVVVVPYIYLRVILYTE